MNSLLKKYFSISFSSHLLAILNFVSFVAVCFISLTLDAISPFNYINIILVAVFIGSSLIYMCLNKIVPKIGVFAICVSLILLCMLTSYFANGFNGFPRTPVLMCLLSIFSYIWFSANKRYIQIYLVGFLVASWLFLLFFTAVEFKTIIHPNLSNRIGTYFGNQNDVARHIMFVFLINCYYIYAFKRKVLIITSVAISFLSSYYLILTGSISNILLLFIIAICFLIAVSKKKARPFIIIAFSIIIIIIVVLLFTISALSPIKNRVLSILSSLFGVGDYRIDSSTIGRFSAAIYGFRLFAESPLFGNGYNSVVNNYKIMAHNNIAEIGADYGIIALIAEEILVLFPFIQLKKTAKKARAFVILFSSYLFLIQFFLVIFNSKIESILIPLIIVISGEKGFFLSIHGKTKKIIKKPKETFYEVIC